MKLRRFSVIFNLFDISEGMWSVTMHSTSCNLGPQVAINFKGKRVLTVKTLRTPIATEKEARRYVKLAQEHLTNVTA